MAVLPPRKNPDPRTDWPVMPKFKHLLSGANLLPQRKPPVAPKPEPAVPAVTYAEQMERTPTLRDKIRQAAASARRVEPEAPFVREPAKQPEPAPRSQWTPAKKK